MCKICYTPFLPIDAARPLSAAALGYKDKYWSSGAQFHISVLGGTQQEIDHIMTACEIWEQYANVTFTYITDWNAADCRVQLDPGAGSWSYIGTDNSKISRDRPTMNLGWIDSDMRDRDYSTALHELGHFLGLGHEHQNPNEPFDWDEQQVFKDLSGPPNNWDEQQIRHNVLRRVAIDEVDATTLDRESIMMYFFDGSWVKSGIGSKQNKVLSKLDKEFISLIYPKATTPTESKSIRQFVKELIYSSNKVNRLDKKQVNLTLSELGEDIDPNQRTRTLKKRLKEVLSLCVMILLMQVTIQAQDTVYIVDQSPIREQMFSDWLKLISNGTGLLGNLTEQKILSPKDRLKASRLKDRLLTKNERQYERGKKSQEQYLIYKQELISIKVVDE